MKQTTLDGALLMKGLRLLLANLEQYLKTRAVELDQLKPLLKTRLKSLVSSSLPDYVKHLHEVA